jgi:hypothetical protein
MLPETLHVCFDTLKEWYDYAAWNTERLLWYF